MTKITVEFEEQVDEGVILLHIEKTLRSIYERLDVRVYKARKPDDSLLRLKRSA